MNDTINLDPKESDPVVAAMTHHQSIKVAETQPLTEQQQTSKAEVLQEDAFSYEGYQVVRGEFFAHMSEPSIAFNKCRVSVNAACLKKLPKVDFVQILINAEEKKLAVRPCGEDEKDSFLWCSNRGNKKKPKQITCRVFFAKLFHLMEWNPEYRYKLLGKLVQSQNERLFAFDLSAPEVYQRIAQDGMTKAARTPTYPAEWQNQFGLDIEEHKKSLHINIFDGYAVFGIDDAGRNTKNSNSITDPEKQENVQAASQEVNLSEL